MKYESYPLLRLFDFAHLSGRTMAFKVPIIGIIAEVDLGVGSSTYVFDLTTGSYDLAAFTLNRTNRHQQIARLPPLI